jgi:hypothetical protein
MSDIGWMVLENIAILAVICFLVWSTGSGWWVLLVLGMNSFTRKQKGTE